MRIAVPKEIVPGERRVALVPQSVAQLIKAGVVVVVESGAGAGAHFPDEAYQQAGAAIAPEASALLSEADVVVKVQPPTFNEALGKHEVELLRSGTVLISFLWSLINHDLVRKLADQGVTSFGMEAMPRIARAQSMDALSSQSSIAGYKAVLIAADTLGKFFPMMITAAGTLAPARGLILGAGVAGLQAIATARRLGAIVEAFDVRPAVKEQVQSLGATFIEVELAEEETEDASGYAKPLSEESEKREREVIHQHVKQADFVVTTALIPGKRAPILVTEDMVRDMRAGSVIVDIAGESGGNCELTEPGKQVIKHGVTINAPLNLPSSVPVHASEMYSRNMTSLLRHLIRDGELHLDMEDSITGGCCITKDGQIIHEATRSLIQSKS